MDDARDHHSTNVIKATFIGLFAILVWGPFIPIARMITDQIGPLGYMGIGYFICGSCGIIKNYLGKKRVLTPAILKHPALYGRWLCFVLHEGLAIIAINIVSPKNVPLIVLIHYLWPTAVIICSVLIAGVRINRRWAFTLGSIIVIGSLAFEILGMNFFEAHVLLGKDILAYSLEFIAAISWGLYSALSRKYGDVTGGANVTVYFQLTFALCLPFYFMSSAMMPWAMPPILLALLVIFAIFGFWAYQSWDYGVRHGNVVALSLCADFIPWLSLISAHLFLHADITPTTMIAAFALVMGAMITRFGTL